MRSVRLPIGEQVLNSNEQAMQALGSHFGKQARHNYWEQCKEKKAVLFLFCIVITSSFMLRMCAYAVRTYEFISCLLY